MSQVPYRLRYAARLEENLFCFQSESSFRSTSSNDMSLYNPPEEKLLYVYESVELELLLTTPKVAESVSEEDVYTCPIRLIQGL